jgi:hypothetical protein
MKKNVSLQGARIAKSRQMDLYFKFKIGDWN